MALIQVFNSTKVLKTKLSCSFLNSFHLEYFLVESEESDIELTGSVDLIKRDYNLAANVQPSIADAIPLATYFAGGGLAGLGVWAADKMLFGGKVIGELLDNAVEITFLISGPWSDPIIEKLDGVKVL